MEIKTPPGEKSQQPENLDHSRRRYQTNAQAPQRRVEKDERDGPRGLNMNRKKERPPPKAPIRHDRNREGRAFVAHFIGDTLPNSRHTRDRTPR